MQARLTILASGSNGNAAYLETDRTRILIDAGLSGRKIRQRLALIDRSPEELDGILVTHEHGDHIRGLSALASKLDIPVYCNRLTKEAIDDLVRRPVHCKVFPTGGSFEVGDLGVETFSLPHDAQDPIGLVIHTPMERLGFLTDLGYPTQVVLDRLRRVNVLVVEANHDVQMLQESTKRPWSIKQRVMSRHGHLSNEGAAACVEGLMSDALRHLYLGHLSQECNTPEAAFKVVTERLSKIGATHVEVEMASQEAPSPTLSL